MIWGKTTKEKHEKVYSVHFWFAWYPVQLDDGRWAWWEHVARIRCCGWDGNWWSYE